jgi:hypothetical protein
VIDIGTGYWVQQGTCGLSLYAIDPVFAEVKHISPIGDLAVYV